MTQEFIALLSWRRGVQRALKRWLGDSQLAYGFLEHRSSLHAFANKIVHGDLGKLRNDKEPPPVARLLDQAVLAARMFLYGDLSCDEFAVRLTHFLIKSSPEMGAKLDADHSAFLDRLAQDVNIAADAKLQKSEWRYIQAMLSHGGRKGGANKSSDAIPFMCTEEGKDPTDGSLIPPRVLQTQDEVVDHMQAHFSNVELGKRLDSKLILKEYNALPDLFRDLRMRLLTYVPTALDLENMMRGLKKGKAPGIDRFPSDLFRTAPQQVAALLCPLLAKVSLFGKEPLMFKLGEVVYFFKGSGAPSLARNQRNILLASTIGKLFHKQVRSLSLKFFHDALLNVQCGGVGGRSTDMVCLGTRLFCRLSKTTKQSAMAMCLDLVQAFYSTVRQIAFDLPGEEERLEHALNSMDIPPHSFSWG